MNKQLGIIIITYNIPVEVLLLQIQCIKKFCTDKFEIIVMDNSDDYKSIESIKYHTSLDTSLIYYKINSEDKNPSDSHAWALNSAYTITKTEYDFLLFLDHDCIPVREFSVPNTLNNCLFAGISQGKEPNIYFWPGCFMLCNKKILHQQSVNFSTEQGVSDTGGMLRLLLKRYGVKRALFFTETSFENPDINYYYSRINHTPH